MNYLLTYHLDGKLPGSVVQAFIRLFAKLVQIFLFFSEDNIFEFSYSSNY